MTRTLDDEIESLRARIKLWRDQERPDKACPLEGQLRGLVQRKINHENLQVEIAMHIGWIEHPDIAAIADGDLEAATQVYGA